MGQLALKEFATWAASFWQGEFAFFCIIGT